MSKDSEMQEMYDQGWSKAEEYFRPRLRDQFAMAALPSVYKDCVATCENIGSFPEKWRDGIAEDVYLMADAMLEARK